MKLQACLKEIHAKMLRKHLQRLEQPLEDEDKAETDVDERHEEEDSEPSDQSTCISVIFK